MTAILGIVGEGSPDELHAMAARMAYRGRYLATWSPAAGVYLGEMSASAPTCPSPGALALDASGNTYPADPGAPAVQKIEGGAGLRARIERELAAHGPDALLDLRANFALAFWSEREASLWLACDRHCYKTLYWVELPGRRAFATDYKALLALADCPARVDRDALQTYLLTLECPGERSLLAGIRPLAAGRLLKLPAPGRPTAGCGHPADRAAAPRRYWTRERRESGQSFPEAARTLRSTLETVISGSLRGQRRIGLTLSGGLDSAALLALTRRVRPDLEIATYTVGNGEDDREILGAREAARHFQTEHHEHFFDLGELPGVLSSFVWLTEEMMGREETLLQQVITRVAAVRDRVLVCGNGADLDFCGMPRHRLLWLRDRAPWPVRGALDELFRYTQIKLEPRTWLGRRLVERVYGADRPAPAVVPGALPPAIDVDYHNLAAYQRGTIGLKGFCYHEPINAQLGITMIAPFSSPEIMEFALECPMGHLIDVRTQKRLLRAAVADLLPPVFSGRRKAIQRLRHDRELSDRMDEMAASLDLDAALASRGLLPPDFVRRLRARPEGGAYSTERMHSLWALISAELWLRQFIDDRGRPIPGFGGEIVVSSA